MNRYPPSDGPGPWLSGLLISLACLAGALVLLVFNWRWVRSATAGPVPITLAELRKLDDPKKLRNPWVTFTMQQSVETGLGISSKSGPKSRYLLAQVEDRWLIVEVPASHQGNTVTGYLDVWGTPLRKKAIGEIEGKFPQAKAALLPYQFDGEYGYRSQCNALLAVVGLLALGGVAMGGITISQVVRSAGQRRRWREIMEDEEEEERPRRRRRRPE